ncbi:MAG: hypothetical protein J5701_08595 [Bacteroidales bacterium]|nr:hypothetical protein [Bacteroidales bacterium]
MEQNKQSRKQTVKRYIRYVFNGKILKDIAWKENLGFILFILVLVIIVINRQLSYMDKITTIEKLNKAIMFSRDKAMDIKEETFNLGLNIENSLLENAETDNFNTSGYLPFIVPKIEEKGDSK